MLKKIFLGHRRQLFHLFGVLFLLTRTIHFASAFVVTSPTSSTILRSATTPPPTTTTNTNTNTNYQLLFDTQLHNSMYSEAEEEIISSADVDSDEDAEQRLGDDDTIVINGDGDGFSVDSNPGNGNGSRFEGLLSSVGLEGKLTHVTDLPAERKVSTYDIFCNRELKLGNCKAIGFDMDYTLAQYQQPAFDQLGFDGTKEKLVNQLG
jgi:hypothetical protein